MIKQTLFTLGVLAVVAVICYGVIELVIALESI